MTVFVLSKTVSADVETTVAHFTAALKDEGFGVLYALDFSEIIASKTCHPLKGRVVGLGVCMPELARQALELDPTVAALLPCGAFVAETPEGTSVGFLDPHAALSLTGNLLLQSLGTDARVRLERALAALD